MRAKEKRKKRKVRVITKTNDRHGIDKVLNDLIQIEEKQSLRSGREEGRSFRKKKKKYIYIYIYIYI